MVGKRLHDQFGYVHHLVMLGAEQLRIIEFQRGEPLRTGGDHFLRVRLVYRLNIVPRQLPKILYISHPQKIVPTAPLVGKNLRLDAQKVQNLQGGSGNIKRIGLDVGEENVEIGKASHEEEVLRLLRRFQIRGYPSQPVLTELRCGHDLHERLQGSAVGAKSFLTILLYVLPDDLREVNVVNVRRASLLALHAGQTGPHGLIRQEIGVLSSHRLGQKPSGREPVVDSGYGTDGGAFTTIQAKVSSGFS